MKEVTIKNVSIRIAELETVRSLGELSLRGEFELSCLRELALRLNIQDIRGGNYGNNDNTAQQFEALAGSKTSSPAITADEIKLFGREMWFAGWYESRHTPNPSGDCNRAFRGTEMSERLATSAGSGKHGA